MSRCKRIHSPPPKDGSVSSSRPTELCSLINPHKSCEAHCTLSLSLGVVMVRSSRLPYPVPLTGLDFHILCSKSYHPVHPSLPVRWLVAFLFSRKDPLSGEWPLFSLSQTLLVHNHNNSLSYLKHWLYVEYMFNIDITHVGISEELIVFVFNRSIDYIHLSTET